MKVWISTVGWSPFAVINPLWAACYFKWENFVPEKVVLLNNQTHDESVKKNYDIVQTWLIKILNEYSTSDPVVESVDANENNMTEYAQTFQKVIEKYPGDEIAIDMTPGRKFMSGIAMWYASQPKSTVAKLYYLQLWGRKYQDVPFIKIPAVNQKLINIKELMKKNE